MSKRCWKAAGLYIAVAPLLVWTLFLFFNSTSILQAQNLRYELGSIDTDSDSDVRMSMIMRAL
jgi:hypothetical protein